MGGGCITVAFSRLVTWILSDEEADPEDAALARRVLAHVLDRTLKLLHPICPFLTEHIWTQMNGRVADRSLDGSGEEPGEFITRSPWPGLDESLIDTEVEHEMGQVQEVIRAIRNIRATAQIHHSVTLDCSIQTDTQAIADGVMRHMEMIADIGVCSFQAVGTDVEKPPKSATEVLPGLRVHIPLEGIIDIDKEIARHRKKIENIEKRIASAEKKLGNKNFTDRAPEEIVQRERDALEEMKAGREQLLGQIESLKG